MSIRTFIIVSILNLLSGLGYGQEQTTPALNFNARQWKLERVDSQILRLQYFPEGYPLEHPATDAVLASTQFKSLALQVQVEPYYRLGANEKMTWDLGWTWETSKTLLQQLQYFEDSAHKGFRYLLEEGEQIFGGGGRALPMNRRGYRFALQNNPWYGYGMGADQLNYSVPFFISSKGYALFVDNPSIGYADIGKSVSNRMELGFTHGALTVYLIRGNSLGNMVEAFARLTGRQPLPPRWALGNLMSRFGYRSEQEVLETVQAMRKADFPVDAVILDLFWFGDSIKGTMGNLAWVNQQKWPSPARMVKQLQDSGIQTILIKEPFVLEGTRQAIPSKPYWSVDANNKPFVLQDFYFGKGGLIDIFHEPAQNWFWQQYQAQKKIGIAGWWGDLGEPEKHPAGLYHRIQVGGKTKLYPAAAVHNIFGHFWSRTLYQQHRKAYPEERLFHLNRAGFAGSARYSVFPWTGDVSRSWDGLQAQIPLMLGLSISGVPYIHSDAGGFAGGEGDPELYTRWLQFACYSPILRPHGTALGDYDTTIRNIPSEPVFWPNPYQDIVRKAIKRRYQLTPYLYTLAWEQTTKGKPFMRPLYYNLTQDSMAYQADGQYMLGDALMVVPITTPKLGKKAVYFPPGTWYDFHSLQAVKGGRWDSVSLTLDNIPVYAKSGSFIPRKMRDMAQLRSYLSDTLLVQYFPGAPESHWVMYNDDGRSANSLVDRKYELLQFDAKEKDRSIRLKVTNDAGYYRGKPNRRLLIFQIPAVERRPVNVKVNNLRIPVQDRFDDELSFRIVPYAVWDPLNQQLYIRADAGGAGLEIEIDR